ncbi:dihydrofolate reductase [Roseobacter denitrificans]|uniref:Dihydrofolate reductase n=1 Tax=Roseobacter denitrificans (strain ATCC 33942 / OCh 114) TaxID=375451 RepID=Q168V7_ROSDO|nr:dihydrofolate reductase [Roseobacter denitrificans]ABG31486.1 dihydrofolate reductase [Roseobacter denitrificans OCh 114]AVL54488.1 dihydrofolate reductase [Roseobacter denitrificans]SFF90832.1 dihydrofolate reductase [Roseobacter denitrificans OCh 114]
MITLIVARAENGAIGRDGTIPWDIPEDLKFFQRETLGGALIMGRNTWESLPVKPLPRRFNIVVSSNSDIAEVVAPSVETAIEIAKAQDHQRIYGIGGASIYAEMLPLAHRLLISEVQLQVPDADTFFPHVDLAEWHQIDRRSLRESDPACFVVEHLRRD